MTTSISGDSDRSPNATSNKRSAPGSRKPERLSKKIKVTDDMDDWQATELLLTDVSARFESLKADRETKAAIATDNVQRIAQLGKENEELKRLARERQEKIGPLQMNLEVAEEEAEIAKKRSAELEAEMKAASSVIQTKLLQVAELEKAKEGLTSKVTGYEVKLDNLQKQHDAQATTLMVVEAAHFVEAASVGMTGQTMEQFGSALDGMREALKTHASERAGLKVASQKLRIMAIETPEPPVMQKPASLLQLTELVAELNTTFDRYAELEAENKAVAERIAEASKSNRKLRKALKAAEKHVDTLTGENEELREKAATMFIDSQQKTGLVVDLKIQLESSVTAMETMRESYAMKEQRRDSCADEIAVLKVSMTWQEREKDDLRMKLEGLTGSVLPVLEHPMVAGMTAKTCGALGQMLDELRNKVAKGNGRAGTGALGDDEPVLEASQGMD
ncbi:hypothetical protein LTR85_000105 [Meristemomyces frigidus]|nr:hypothetical protein LTR85_000105 [Meristemomyces frigidus]